MFEANQKVCDYNIRIPEKEQSKCIFGNYGFTMKFIVLVVHYPVLVVQYNDTRTRMFEQIMDKIRVKHPEQNLFGHLHQHLWHPNGRPRIGLTDLFEHSAWTAIWVDAFRYSILYPLKDMFKYL